MPRVSTRNLHRTGNGRRNLSAAVRPAFNIDGQAESSLGEHLQTLQVIHNTQGLARSEAVFNNWVNGGSAAGFLYFDRRILDFGKSFQVLMGNAVVFDGRITGLEAQFPNTEPPRVRIVAEDAMVDFRMTKRTRTFENVSFEDVIRRMGGDHGLTVNVDVASPTFKILAQVNQSDWAFLQGLARDLDIELVVEGHVLNARAADGDDSTAIRLTYGRGLRQFTVLADATTQCTRVVVGGWDVDGKSALRAEAGLEVLHLDFLEESGARILEWAWGTRQQVIARAMPLTSDQAQTYAESYFKQIARKFIVGQGLADGNNRLRAGGKVNLLGLGPLFSGNYYLTEVRQRFDLVDGWVTEFVAERAVLSDRQQTQTQDPEGTPASNDEFQPRFRRASTRSARKGKS